MPNIVYFIGAGLSKALERLPYRVPVMNDFVNVAADYVEQDDVVLTTLAVFAQQGLFTNPASERLRMISARLREIAPGLADGRARDPQLKSEFAHAMKAWPGENLETMLQRAPRHQSDSDARFNFAVNRVFCHIGWQVNWAPLERFIDRQASDPRLRHTFVSFNYDLLLDRALSTQTTWAAPTGYGLDIRFVASAEAGEILANQMSGSGGAFGPVDATPVLRPSTSANWMLLKPHGSLNWLLTDRKEVRPHSDEVALVMEHGAISYFRPFKCDALMFPGAPAPIAADLPLLPPVDNKHELFRWVHRVVEDHEEQALAAADEAYVIGWSVPETDQRQQELIRDAVARCQPLRRLTVISLGARPDYFEKVADLFKVPTHKTVRHNRGFASFTTSGCERFRHGLRRVFSRSAGRI
ncbi:MAG: hypothetical protein HY047_14605 [Acidobacteria bacterium]|nr:hypothetical protein [Acidobacteriota bacterium]